MTTLDGGLGVAEWTVWTTTASLVVTDAALLPAARSVVEEELRGVDAAASRFRADSEVRRLAELPGRGGGSVVAPVSARLTELLRAALTAASDTDGAVDPTLGRDLIRLGYGGGAGAGVPTVDVRRRITWRDVQLIGRELRMPAGTLLDLGATAKAWAADRCAEAVLDHCGCGVLVNLGGDLRVAGPEPAGGWQVLVSDGPAEPSSRIRLHPAAALATSSTLHRRWRAGEHAKQHLIDPWLRLPAPEVWRTVTVAADTCVAANTLSSAAVIRGQAALALLRHHAATARLVAADGSVVNLGGWPE